MYVRVICPTCRTNRRVEDRQLPLGIECPKCPGSYMDIDPKSLPPLEITPTLLSRRGRAVGVHPSIRVASLWDRLLGAVYDAVLGFAVALPGLAVMLVGGSAAVSLGWTVYGIGVGLLTLVNLALMFTRGQTVGKFWAGTYYARTVTGEPAGILRLIILRPLLYAPLYVAFFLLQQGPGWALLLVSALFLVVLFADFLVMLLVPTHRRIVDYAAGTIVARA
ncbi:MAG TPA: RDD family protein [Gemmataceae bacterium]|nr:RDD family protein [Gemmataceae bacterium]